MYLYKITSAQKLYNMYIGLIFKLGYNASNRYYERVSRVRSYVEQKFKIINIR